MGREHLHLPEGFRQDVEAAALVLGAVFIAGALLLGAGDPSRACWAAGGHFGPVGGCLRWSLFGAVGAPAAVIVPTLPVLIAMCILARLEARATVRWLAFLAGLTLLVSIAVAIAHGGIAHPFQYDAISGFIGNALGFALTKPLGIAGAWLFLVLAAFALAVSTVARDAARFIRGPRPPRRRRSTEPVSVVAVTVDAPAMTDVVSAAEPEPAQDAALPSPDLLVPVPPRVSDAANPPGDAVEFSLVAALRALKIDVTIVDRKRGPSVARYDVEPSPSSPIRDCQSVAAALTKGMRTSVRVAPIERRGALGVELPSGQRTHVGIRELIESAEYRQSPRSLPIAFGRDVDNTPVVADLAKMPHLLVAGDAASGKSVFLHSMVASLLCAHSPSTLRFLIADSDDGGLASYNALPHLCRGVVTDYRKVGSLLDLALLSMRGRNELRVASGARNIQEFNQRARDGALGKLPAGTWIDGRVYTGGPLPYLVVIIDDVLELVRTGGPEIEHALSQLAEKGRVVGIHMVGVTKHTDAEAVTPALRAMFPGRAAFRMADAPSSRAIIDAAGAESLLGAGDMLFLAPGKSDPTRIQAPFTSPEDTRRLMEWYGAPPEAGEAAAVRAPNAEQRATAGSGTQSGEHLAA